MIDKHNSSQQQLEMVYIENLVPQDHILRQIDKYIDFSFIRDITKDLYCENNGRPAVDPIILFKMLFIGYLFGIRSERQLVKDIQVNVAYRWFLGYSLTDTIPNHSTISQNRRRRFKDTDVSQQIFDNIVEQAINKNLVSGKILYSDSTHLKANANKNKFIKQQVEVSAKEYIDELENAVDEDRILHGKKALKKKVTPPETKEIKVSTTDPESGYMVRDRKPKGFFYLDHRTVDSKYNIITDVFVTPGNINDVDPYLSRIDRQINRFGFKVKYVGIDAGYFTNNICKGLADRNIISAIAYRIGPHIKGKFTKNKFEYVNEWDCYICPQKYPLRYKTTTRQGYKEYISNENNCSNCPKKHLCLTNEKAQSRTIRRHVWENFKDKNIAFLRTAKGKSIYRRRKETVERSFADSKELHGLRYCHMRGLEKVSEQCLLTAAVQNMKKIVRVLSHLFFNIDNFKSIYSITYNVKLHATA